MAFEPKIMTGARGILKINGQVIAYASNVSWTRITAYQTINVLGMYSTARFEPTGYDCTVNCSIFRFTKEGGQGNSPERLGIRPTLQTLISSPDITIEVIDRKTNETVLLVKRARCTQDSGGIDARGIYTINCNFVGVWAEDSDSPDQSEASPAGKIPPNTGAAD